MQRLKHARPTDLAYFTGNSKYYTHLQQLNTLLSQKFSLTQPLLQKHLDYSVNETSPKINWMTLPAMKTDLEFRLSLKEYQDLVLKLDILYAKFGTHDDVKPVLKKYMPIGKQLPITTKIENVLEEGISTTFGTRKTTKCECKMKLGSGLIMINGKPLNQVVTCVDSRRAIIQPFVDTASLCKYNTWIATTGGGSTGIRDSAVLAIKRGLQMHGEGVGEIKVDNRLVERKKTGQPKARKKNTWVKR